MTPEIKTEQRMEPHTDTTHVHYCGTTNVEPKICTLAVLPLNQEPTAELIALHDREVRDCATAELAAGRAHLLP